MPLQWRSVTRHEPELCELQGSLGIERGDPHGVWACASRFEGYSAQTDSPAEMRHIPLAVEVDEGADLRHRQELAAMLRPPAVYDTNVGGDRYWTGVISAAHLAVVCGHAAVKAWRIGLPGVPGQARPVPCHDPGPPQPLPGNGPVIGLIDHGLAFAHAAFHGPRGSGQPRILAFWDQEPERCTSRQNPHGDWQPVAGLGYGGELDRATLGSLLAHFGTNERVLYRRLRYKPALDLASHGTAVLDLAAGDPNPLPLQGAPDAPDGLASVAPIVAVQLPYVPMKDTSGGSLCVHVLDALHYIVSRAGSRAVVVNLSDGAYAGPHSGDSLLERAIDDFLVRHPQVHLVLAAGNAHEGRGHASATLQHGNQELRLRWRVLPDDITDSFVEVWFDRCCNAGGVELTLTPPGGWPPVTVPLGESQLLMNTAASRAVAAVLSRAEGGAGPKRSMFLIAIGPTRASRRGGSQVPHGVWTIEVRNRSASVMRVDGWVERDNPAFGDRGPKRQSFFEDDHRRAVASGQGTLGSVAGCREAVVVGGRYLRGKVFNGTDARALSIVARYSSRGPERRSPTPPRGPDLLAPSDESPVLHGLRVAANRSGATIRLDGTSVAAPVVTRRVFGLLVGDPLKSRAQIKDDLVPSPQTDPQHAGLRGWI